VKEKNLRPWWGDGRAAHKRPPWRFNDGEAADAKAHAGFRRAWVLKKAFEDLLGVDAGAGRRRYRSLTRRLSFRFSGSLRLDSELAASQSTSFIASMPLIMRFIRDLLQLHAIAHYFRGKTGRPARRGLKYCAGWPRCAGRTIIFANDFVHVDQFLLRSNILEKGRAGRGLMMISAGALSIFDDDSGGRGRAGPSSMLGVSAGEPSAKQVAGRWCLAAAGNRFASLSRARGRGGPARPLGGHAGLTRAKIFFGASRSASPKPRFALPRLCLSSGFRTT